MIRKENIKYRHSFASKNLELKTYVSDFVFRIKRCKFRQITLSLIEIDKNEKLAVTLLSPIKKCRIFAPNIIFNAVLPTCLFLKKHFTESYDAM